MKVVKISNPQTGSVLELQYDLVHLDEVRMLQNGKMVGVKTVRAADAAVEKALAAGMPVLVEEV